MENRNFVTGEITRVDNAATMSRADALAIRIEQVKDEAKARILAAIGGDPEKWAERQMNIISRGVELVDKRVTGQLTAAEATERSQIQSVWDAVKAIRAASDAIEADLAKLETAVDIFDHDIANAARWP